MRATLVSIHGSSMDCIINVSGSMGKSGQEHRTYQVSAKCKVYINGQLDHFGNLRAGDALEIEGKPAVKITATRK